MTAGARRHVARRPHPLVHQPRHRRLLGLAAVCAVSAAALSACATPQQVLHPIANVPTNCAAIDAELLALAEIEGQWRGIKQAKDGAVLGVSLAAAAGVLPAGFAWAPLGAMIIQQISLPSKTGRLNYLAQTREIRQCAPLSF